VNLTETELDRLADYTVDVLEPQDAAEVAGLIQTDPRWATAYRSLMDADVAVGADLSSFGRTPEPMPADVVARIDTALAGLPSRAKVASNVVSLDQARARRRRTMARLAGAAAAAVAVGGGIAAVTQSSIFTVAGTAERADTAAGAPAPVPPAAAGAGPRVLASGTDYELDSLPALSATAYPFAADSGALKSDAPRAAAEAAGAAGGPLTRLTGAALQTCLDAVLGRHPGTVAVLDYARYLGQPSLVIVVRQVAGSIVVAVGEDCGLAGPDEKAAVPAP
jgi:hypothetical protein